MRENLPWRKHDVASWLIATRRADLSFGEMGVLISLLDEQWHRGSLPSSPTDVAELLGMRGLHDGRLKGIRFTFILDRFFPVSAGDQNQRRDDELWQQWLEADTKAIGRRRKAQDAARKRWETAKSGQDDD